MLFLDPHQWCTTPSHTQCVSLPLLMATTQAPDVAGRDQERASGPGIVGAVVGAAAGAATAAAEVATGAAILIKVRFCHLQMLSSLSPSLLHSLH